MPNFSSDAVSVYHIMELKCTKSSHYSFPSEQHKYISTTLVTAYLEVFGSM